MAGYAKLSIEFFSLPQSGRESSVSPTNQSITKKNYLAVKLQVVLPCINRFMLINVLLKNPLSRSLAREIFPFIITHISNRILISSKLCQRCAYNLLQLKIVSSNLNLKGVRHFCLQENISTMHNSLPMQNSLRLLRNFHKFFSFPPEAPLSPILHDLNFLNCKLMIKGEGVSNMTPYSSLQSLKNTNISCFRGTCGK